MKLKQGYRWSEFGAIPVDWEVKPLRQISPRQSLCGGSTFLEIGKTQLRTYPVLMPPTKEEQTAIATILSDMDTDIAALQAKLAKARHIKQGMMQQLLTGQIRLV